MGVKCITEPITVSQLNSYIKNLIGKDKRLNNVFIKGEISTLSQAYSGHLYFSIKDKNSIVNCVMFRYSAKENLNLETGMKILVNGKVDVYAPQGKYQIIAYNITQEGVGKLYAEFEKLKKKLKDEGLFNEDIKKEIPKFPRKIGVVTAPKGAVIRDIITTVKRRWPYCEIILFPSLVQGANAPPEIIRQIKHSQNYDLDVLIVRRGGGSIEDLWCFNDENVARAIFDCKIPTISAVGHEVDFTIADFVADKRAPTPTAAAELAVPQKEHMEKQLKQLNIRLNETIKSKIYENRQKLDNIVEKQIFKDPKNLYQTKKDKYDLLINRFQLNSNNIIVNKKAKFDKIKSNYVFKDPKHLIEKQKHDLSYYINKIEVLNPLLTLKRGYNISRVDGKIVSKASSLKKDDIVELEFDDGKVNTKVL